MCLWVIGSFSMQGWAQSEKLKAQSGSCQGFEFPLAPDGGIDWPHTVKVLKHDTPVYADALSLTPLDGLFLSFNKSLEVLESQGSRLQVRTLGSLDPLGWVESSTLLCALRPQSSFSSGLEQKLYIKTATEIRKEKPTTVQAYPSPNLQGPEEASRELSRFTGYFVFDYNSEYKSYLLGESYQLDQTSSLVGWVSEENGFLWDTAYGLRPAEDLIFPESHELAGQERTICAYQTIEDALENRRCLPILGGNRWYRYEDRIPLLDRVIQNRRAFYKVVLPMAGMGVKYEERDGKIRIIEPGKFSENPGINSVLSMKRIDVLFLIDGTKSMMPYIEAVRGSKKEGRKGVIQDIIDSLQQDDAFQEAQFRFAFRIYRDRYAGEKNLGEGLPLSTVCELTNEAKAENIRSFEQKIDTIAVTTSEQDDYAENLFGGIRQAVRDLAPCPNNTKLLFVIGDCGYDASMQKQPLSTEDLLTRLKGDDEFKSIVPFFIQTPSSRDAMRQPEKYDQAYRLFHEQGERILREILGPSRLSEIGNYLMSTTDAELNSKIITGIKQFSNTQAINELVLDLRGGTPLKDAIQRLQGSQEFKNIPGLFWDLVKQGSCKKLGEQCEERIYDTIQTAYIPISDDVVEDIWLKSNDLEKWKDLLRDFENLSNLSGTELRETFVYALRDSVEKVIRKPLYKDTGQSLKEFLKRKGGLPVRENSPLFSYSIDDLRDPDTVPDCEIIRLAAWVNSVKQMLSIVLRGKDRPKFIEREFPGQCPSGEAIPFIDGDIDFVPLGESDMRYDHSFQKAHVYWVPKEFLP
ncbi:hypothetical protein CSB45_02890 [candidate division KSB3 bacterium]|uniref:VWFA domain-containing protein n=1 Tax=candidate division KSB3 bacterium TaxID=2044937 RepID=A0A2G6E983_9BACT|nr:MAG: hypothetical protein CSB45_02890 [candidate division KSB3 bacterium]PIE29015.1 MAG: hypothetical protein CSA57_11190 [candidate division KSB3 bacterium]